MSSSYVSESFTLASANSPYIQRETDHFYLLQYKLLLT